jgi:hypothetical protein
MLKATTKLKYFVLNITIFLSSIFILLIFLEYLFRIFNPGGISYFHDAAIYFSHRNMQYVPIKKHKPEIQYELTNFNVKINSYGLRDYEYLLNKPPGATRILALGDSVTFGFGVNLEDTYTKILEQSALRAD